MKMVVEKLQSHAEMLKTLRDRVNFSPKDGEQVKQWEEEQRSSSNPLVEFLATWHNMKELTTADGGHDDEVEIPNTKNSKGKEKRKQANGEEAVVPAKKKKKTKKSKEKERTFNNNEDIVEDYDLSDDM